MGITRIANVTGLDYIGIPVVMVCRPNSRALSVSQGKGLDLAAARASGLMESVESFHAERINLPLKLASYEELRYTHKVVDVTRLPSVPDSRFHGNLQLLWIMGRELISDTPVWVPFETVHLNYTTAHVVGEGSFLASSNGLASGNHLLEAISHAICEVVERDADAVWKLDDPDALTSRRVDLNTIDDPDCLRLLELFERARVTVAVWDTTSDVGIPSFLCEIVDEVEDRIRALYACTGHGCHPTRRIALLRALTEAAQSRLTAIAGSRDDLSRADYERTRSPDALRRSRKLTRGQGMRSFADAPNWESVSFNGDIEWELERLQAVGVNQVIAVDLTRSEFNIPVVRVIVPGLEGPPSYAYTPGERARRRTGTSETV